MFLCAHYALIVDDQYSLIQYASRALWDSLESADMRPGMVEDFKSLEYILSTFRKREYVWFSMGFIYL